MKQRIILSVIALTLLTTSAWAQTEKVTRTHKSEKRQTVKKNTNTQSLCPDSHHPHAIDMGLGSGTKWSCMNVDATKPEAYGSLFAWGETKEKAKGSWSNYIHCDGDEKTCHDIGRDISGTRYDVAHVKWGGDWKMPTMEQMTELYFSCTMKWTTLNGVNGYMFTSDINGNSLFFPAALEGPFNTRFGAYWLSSLEATNSRRANILFFEQYDADTKSSSRCNSISVRPVIGK